MIAKKSVIRKEVKSNNEEEPGGKKMIFNLKNKIENQMWSVLRMCLERWVQARSSCGDVVHSSGMWYV